MNYKRKAAFTLRKFVYILFSLKKREIALPLLLRVLQVYLTDGQSDSTGWPILKKIILRDIVQHSKYFSSENYAKFTVLYLSKMHRYIDQQEQLALVDSLKRLSAVALDEKSAGFDIVRKIEILE